MKKKNKNTFNIKHPGSLTKMAKSAGKSIDSYCAQSGLSPAAKKKCQFYKNIVKRKS